MVSCLNLSLYLRPRTFCLTCVQLFHQRRDIDVIHAAALDVRDRAVPAPLPQEVLRQRCGLAGLCDFLKRCRRRSPPSERRIHWRLDLPLSSVQNTHSWRQTRVRFPITSHTIVSDQRGGLRQGDAHDPHLGRAGVQPRPEILRALGILWGVSGQPIPG